MSTVIYDDTDTSRYPTIRIMGAGPQDTASEILTDAGWKHNRLRDIWTWPEGPQEQRYGDIHGVLSSGGHNVVSVGPGGSSVAIDRAQYHRDDVDPDTRLHGFTTKDLSASMDAALYAGRVRRHAIADLADRARDGDVEAAAMFARAESVDARRSLDIARGFSLFKSNDQTLSTLVEEAGLVATWRGISPSIDQSHAHIDRLIGYQTGIASPEEFVPIEVPTIGSRIEHQEREAMLYGHHPDDSYKAAGDSITAYRVEQLEGIAAMTIAAAPEYQQAPGAAAVRTPMEIASTGLSRPSPAAHAHDVERPVGPHPAAPSAGLDLGR